jgi:formylglycine-generating enzyme required for sulfatase activity
MFMRVKAFLYMAAATFLFAGCSNDNPANPGGTLVTPPAGMKQIAGGTLMMSDTVTGYTWSTLPLHSVTLSSFFMDSTEVTVADYQALMGVDPSYYPGDSLLPVEYMTWFDAALYCNARSKRDTLDTVYSYSSITGTPGDGCSLGGLVINMSTNGYRLPTEAEWEYACRAGTATDFYWGRSYPAVTLDDTLTIDSNAIWYHNSPSAKSRVASKKPNAFGLYDMAGNVFEWCGDWYSSTGDTSVHVDPTGPLTGTTRLQRGGSAWANSPRGYYYLRSAARVANFPSSRFYDSGFRCVKR